MKKLLQDVIEIITTGINPKYTWIQINSIIQRASQEIQKLENIEKDIPTNKDIDKAIEIAKKK